jgi:hypothetical protein
MLLMDMFAPKVMELWLVAPVAENITSVPAVGVARVGVPKESVAQLLDRPLEADQLPRLPLRVPR